MCKDRRQPGVAFWTTVVVVVGLAYPLSFGPALWIGSHALPANSQLLSVYRPVAWVFHRLPPDAKWFATYRVIMPAIRASGRNLIFSSERIYFVD